MEVAKLILEFVQALIWPAVVVGLLVGFRRQVATLLPRLKQAELPGGVKVDFHEALAEANQLKKDILSTPDPHEKAKIAAATQGITLTNFNERMLTRGLQPTPSGLDLGYYRTLAEKDPNIALAGLRLEIETIGKNLATGYSIELAEQDVSALAVFRKLLDRGAITQLQFELSKSVIALCNSAVHGERVDKEQANTVLDIASVLLKDYIAWLSWGFPEHRDHAK